MACRVLSQGFRVFGYNRTRSKAEALRSEGLAVTNTPREATEIADIIITMVTGNEALQSVLQGDHGILSGLSPGKVLVDMSTISPVLSRNTATLVREKGADMLDAPVSGSILTLNQGKLSIMVGGDAGCLAKVLPVLNAIGPTVGHIGPNGMGVTMKIATNLNLVTQILSFAESVCLAQKCGISKEIAVETLLNSAVASPVLKYRGPFIQSPPDHAWFNVRMMQKDVKLALDLAAEVGVSLPSTALANQFLNSARAMGLDEEDYAAVYQVLAVMAGLSSDSNE